MGGSEGCFEFGIWNAECGRALPWIFDEDLPHSAFRNPKSKPIKSDF
jgi:hypothetical protein